MHYHRFCKRFISIVLTFIFIHVPVTVFAREMNTSIPVFYDKIKVSVNGERQIFDKEPFMYENTVYLPIRETAEAVGMGVRWDNKTKTVALSENGAKVVQKQTHGQEGHSMKKVIPVRYNNIKITVNNRKIETGKEPFIYEGTTYLPLRAVAEAVGMEVAWRGDAKEVVLTKKSTSVSVPVKNHFQSIEEALRQNDLPDYWNEYLAERISHIKMLQKMGGANSFSFAAMTDLHESSNLGKESGTIAKTIMNACDIRYALVLGDVVNRGAMPTCELMAESFENAEEILSPIRDRALQVEGNHDGAWGYDANGAYTRRFSNEEMERYIYDKVAEVEGVTFADCGYAYYADDEDKKVRYIMLNTHYYDEQTFADGRAVNNPFSISRFGQKQYDFLVHEALNVPEEWSIIIGGHVAISDAEYPKYWWGNSKDNELMRDMLTAYNHREKYNESIDGTIGTDRVTVNADFSKAKGRVIAYFAGHQHIDSLERINDLAIITVRNDARTENVDGNAATTEDDMLYAERIKGTITEQSFDIVTVNTEKRIIYMTKIGAGEDRTIRY